MYSSGSCGMAQVAFCHNVIQSNALNSTTGKREKVRWLEQVSRLLKAVILHPTYWQYATTYLYDDIQFMCTSGLAKAFLSLLPRLTVGVRLSVAAISLGYSSLELNGTALHTQEETLCWEARHLHPFCQLNLMIWKNITKSFSSLTIFVWPHAPKDQVCNLWNSIAHRNMLGWRLEVTCVRLNASDLWCCVVCCSARDQNMTCSMSYVLCSWLKWSPCIMDIYPCHLNQNCAVCCAAYHITDSYQSEGQLLGLKLQHHQLSHAAFTILGLHESACSFGQEPVRQHSVSSLDKYHQSSRLAWQATPSHPLNIGIHCNNPSCCSSMV